MFSVVILTLNEERNLPRCLASLQGCDDVVVLDSGSTDATVALAKRHGARVLHRPFDNFAAQRNHAHRVAAFRHPWVFHLDADEEFTPALHAECSQVGDPPDIDGFMVAPQMIFMDRWIPHCTDFPAWQTRFVHAQRFEFIEVGHGQREALHMRLGKLRASYRHHIDADDIDGWLEKHRRYARAEAREHFAATTRLRGSHLFSSDPLDRRRALKRLSYALPARPALRFIYQYFLRRGFLDGAPGFRYCRLLARYEGLTTAELRRLRRNAA